MTGGTRAGRMHEWPLVVFTAIAIPAAGMFAARPIANALDVAVPPWLATTAAAALLAALAFSVAHLGRPLRAPLAAWRAGRNALSTEVLLAALLLGVEALEHVARQSPALQRTLMYASGGTALLFLVVVGLVYFLPARRPWPSALIVSPVVLGLAGASMACAIASPASAMNTVTLLLLLLDAIVTVPPWARHLSSLAPGFLPVHPALFERRRSLVALRFAMVDIAPAALLVSGLSLGAGIVLGAGIWIDRFAFYATACARSTEAEIVGIEDLIAAGDPGRA